MNWDKIEQLFNIGTAAQVHGPKYASIISAAQLELEEHVAEAQKVIEAKRKADEEEAGRLRAEAANKARVEAEKAKVEEDKQKEAQASAARAAFSPTRNATDDEKQNPTLTERRI